MYLTLTFALLLAVTAMLVLLRLRWMYLSPYVRRAVLVTACTIVTIFLLGYSIHWATASARINTIAYWLFLACCEFFVLLLTLLPPRWLTSLIAVVLLLPILSASIFLPLTAVFAPPPVTTPLGDHLVSVTEPWTSGKIGVSGVDIDILYRPAWAPFLQHRRQTDRLYETQCDTAKATATLQPDRQSILFDCPANPYQPSAPGIHVVVHLN